MLRAIGQLKKRDDIVVTKPDKGSGVVVMDKTDYVRLLKESSINDETKFTPIGLERPRTRGRPPKHYHPLLQKEKELSSVVQRILPKTVADSVIQKGSRLAHLYGLPKTHKKKLAMRPILSAKGTYNYKPAKWLDEKLKPLSVNDHTVSDIFQFAEELHGMEINDHEILGCVRLGNLDLDFQNPDFGFPIEREIRKRISTLRYLFLDFHFYRSIGKSEKGFEKLFLRTAVLHAHA